MEFSEKGIKLILEFEGKHKLRPDGRYEAYLDTLAKPNVPTIYAGLTKGIKMGMVITEEQGERMFYDELAVYRDGIERLVKVPLNPNQAACLLSFTYNCGVGALQKSTLLKKLNKGLYSAVPAELAKWNKAGGRVWPGLTRRRAAEAALWLATVDEEAIVPPDPMPQRVEPSQKPAAVTIKESPTAQVSILGIVIGAVQQGWSWTIGLFKEAGPEAISTQQAIGPFDALLKAVGANLPQITIAILMATLLIVLVRKIQAGKA